MSQIKTVEGYLLSDPMHIHTVNVCLDSWDGIENQADQDIYFYMDGLPLNVGSTLDGDFFVTDIWED